MNTNERTFSTRDVIRSMVRSAYDMQKLRIQMGNRITANWKTKLGLETDDMDESKLDKLNKSLLDQLREDYRRLTDGVIAEGNEAVQSKMPTPKKFKPGQIISSFAELVLINQYMSLLANEEASFKNIDRSMAGIPIYDNFLSKQQGIGPAMAGVIISEIDIHVAKYPSSLWSYAGLDVVEVATYVDDKGKEHTIPADEVRLYHAENPDKATAMLYGEFPVKFSTVGRSKKDVCLVNREYQNKDGETKERRSITFNPFLKTKLIGVLGTSFLRTGTSTVDGVKCGGAARLKMAISEGYEIPEEGDVDNESVIHFLRSKGHEVVVEASKYGKMYYDYKMRLENNPAHAEKSKSHRHAMAIRYAVKQFLADLYVEWRTLEGLPVAVPYAEAKLGLTHGEVSSGKLAA